MHRAPRHARLASLATALLLALPALVTAAPAALAGGGTPTCSVDASSHTLEIYLAGSDATITRDGTEIAVSGICGDASFDSVPAEDDFTSIAIVGYGGDPEQVTFEDGTEGSAWGWAGLYTVTIDLGDGSDDSVFMYGTQEADTIDAQAFATYVGVDSVTIYGDLDNGDPDGDNTLTGVTALPNTIYGALGDDRIYGGSVADDLNGNDGDDRLSGLQGDDGLYGQDGADTLVGGAGADDIIGAGGADTLDGGPGADFLDGGDAADLIYGGADADELDGGPDADLLDGGSGNDLLESGDGDDFLYGRAGDDNVYGDNDDDSLYGGSGADLLYGRAGDDYLDGGSGADSLEGDGGSNTCLGYVGSPTGVRRYKGDTYSNCTSPI